MKLEHEYEAVLRAVAKWPAEDRALLAHALIDSLRPPDGNGAKPSLEQLVGIGRGEGDAPSDEQVRQWIDEHRTRKYGQ
jgi:hypothetical protein